MPDDTFTLSDLAATQAMGQRLACTLSAGDVVAFHGELGAGKTALARAIIQALCPDETEVPSPTFTLVQHYEGEALAITHFDLYRLQQPDEVLELGWHDAMLGLVLVEWPERLGAWLPPGAIHIEIHHGANADERLVTIRNLKADIVE